ncbi:MAG: ABC transporter ATP-binding protein [Sedimentisphaerales bacterium]|nr:ABC transporter ATP-binding protein [Sedimentisphaerales bacterium]
MNSDKPIVQIRGLCKKFSKVIALDKADLDIYPGCIVGLLGANGAGKSTLLRHIIGLYLPDSGQCSTFDCEAEKLGPRELGRIGYVHQEGELLEWMKVRQLIRYVAAYYPNWNMELEQRYIAEFDISINSRVGKLSPGERQKLAILLAIGFDPELLILDEPASALDPVARANFLNLMLEIIQDETRAIIISSHILSDVEKIMNRTVIMKKGRIICDSDFDELLEKYCRIRISIGGGKLPENLPFTDIINSQQGDGQVIFTIRNTPKETIEQLAEKLKCEIEIQPLPFEEIYRIEVS